MVNVSQFRGKDIKATKLSGFFDFLERYWLPVALLMLGTPYIMKWFANLKVNAETAKQEAEVKQQVANSKASGEQNKIQDVKVIKSKSDSVLKGFNQVMKDRLNAATRALANALGTDKPWYDPTGWTENDSDVAKVLTDNWNYFSYLENLYQYVYTDSRNLKSDIYSKLDKSDFEKVKAYYKTKKSRVWG